MKKTNLIIALIIALSVVSCQKNGNTNTKTNEGVKTETQSQSIADDNSSAKIEDLGENITVDNLISSNGENLKAEYFFKGEKAFVRITYNDSKPYILPQTIAWAKGAEYDNGNIKWEAQNDKGKLTIDKKVISFTKKK